MTELERRAARLLCAGFHGDDAATFDASAIAELGPGGIIVFGRNVTTPDGTRALVEAVASAIAARTGTRPFAGVDQEGGRVARFRAGATAMPSAMAIGATDDAVLAEAAGRAVAADVRRFGCDVDFAPVLDLALRSESRVVGTRSFGSDPVRAGALGSAFARGLAAGGVAAVAKHAPGHGATALDSHDELPVLGASAEMLFARDLAPFRHAVASGVRAVMLAHVVVPALGALPASLDPGTIAFVRASVSSETVLLTDCLQMGALAGSFGTAEAAARAIAAGADVAIVSHDLGEARAAARAIARDVELGVISFERFEAALAAGDRFRAYARALGAAAGAAPAAGQNLAYGDDVARAVARAAVTRLRASATRPVFAAGDAVTIVSFERAASRSAEAQGVATGAGASDERPSLALALRRRRLRAEMLRVPTAPSLEEIEALELVLAGQGGRALVVLARGARHEPAQALAIERLAHAAGGATLVCLGEPFDAAALAAPGDVLCTYGDGPHEIEALADVLTGALEPAGVVPVGEPSARDAARSRSRLRHGAPFAALDATIARFLGTRYTGAVVRVERGGTVVYEQAAGAVDDSAGAAAVTSRARFDLASLTKLFVASAALEAVHDGALALDAPLTALLPEWQETAHAAVTLRMLLAHTGGLQSGADYRTLFTENVEAYALLRPLVAAPGAGVVYSDLGFIALGVLLARVRGRSLSSVVGETVRTTGGFLTAYRPRGAERAAVPATEDDPWRGRVRGVVHDEKAYLLGGVAGHAGLFGTAADVAALGEAYLGAALGRSGKYLPEALAREALREQGADETLRRGLGWALKTRDDNSCGPSMSRATFGHTGFTGTCVWIDPERDLSVTMLSNAVYYGRTDLRDVRIAINEAAVAAFAP